MEKEKHARGIQEHDISYKQLFGEKDVFLDFLRCSMKESMVDFLSARQLCKMPTEFIQKTRLLSKNDLIWMTKDGAFLFPIEFQSSFDPHMNSRMINYIGNAIRACCEYTGKTMMPYIFANLVSNIGNAEKFATINHGFRKPDLQGLEFKKFAYSGELYSTLDMIDFRPDIKREGNLVHAIHEIELFRTGKRDSTFFIGAMQRLDKMVDIGDHQLDTAFLGWIKSDLFRNSGILTDGETREKLSGCNTIKETLSMLENAMPLWQKRIFDEGAAKERADVLFGMIEDTYKLKDIPENIKKMALKTCEKIGIIKSLNLIQSSSTLDEYENRISAEEKTENRSKPAASKKPMPRP